MAKRSGWPYGDGARLCSGVNASNNYEHRTTQCSCFRTERRLGLHGHEGAVDLLRVEVELELAEGGRPGEARGGVEAVAPQRHALQAAVDSHAVRERAEAWLGLGLGLGSGSGLGSGLGLGLG
jgi:hypothetical protein